MTYKKIADLAHVSLSTVSKALSGSSDVSNELKEKIIKIAIEQGYFSEKNKLRRDNTDNQSIGIAVICPEIISVTYSHAITNIKNEIELIGGTASVYIHDFDTDKMNKLIENITVRRSADGIIVFPTDGDIMTTTIPTVAISSKANCDTVYCDVTAYFDEIVEYLKDMGHREIAFVGEKYTMEKLRAYKSSIEKHGILYRDENVYVIDGRFEKIGYEAAERMIKNNRLPTAVICAYDEIALAMIHRSSENGIKVPETVSIVGINDIPSAQYSSIPLTTVKTFKEDLGRIAVGVLYDKIFGNDGTVRHVTIGHEFIERKTVCRCKEV